MKIAVITGASQRLGLYLTERLIEKGWHVYALTRASSPALNELANDQLTIISVGDYRTENVREAISQIQTCVSTVDVLINNASIFVDDDVAESSSNFGYKDMSFIHVEMPHILMNQLQGQLSKANGNIISITDIYSDNPNPKFSLYCSTKAGLQNLTLSAAKRWAPEIRANCIQPGPIKFLPEHSDEQKEAVMNQTLLAWEGGFDPIFKTVEFIIENTYLTGQCINVDGGRSLVRG